MGKRLKTEKVEVKDYVAEWRTAEEQTASAMTKDMFSPVDEAKVKRKLAYEVERIVNSGEVTEVIVQNIRELIIKWRKDGTAA